MLSNYHHQTSKSQQRQDLKDEHHAKQLQPRDHKAQPLSEQDY